MPRVIHVEHRRGHGRGRRRFYLMEKLAQACDALTALGRGGIDSGDADVVVAAARAVLGDAQGFVEDWRAYWHGLRGRPPRVPPDYRRLMRRESDRTALLRPAYYTNMKRLWRRGRYLYLQL